VCRVTPSGTARESPFYRERSGLAQADITFARDLWPSLPSSRSSKKEQRSSFAIPAEPPSLARQAGERRGEDPRHPAGRSRCYQTHDRAHQRGLWPQAAVLGWQYGLRHGRDFELDRQREIDRPARGVVGKNTSASTTILASRTSSSISTPTATPARRASCCCNTAGGSPNHAPVSSGVIAGSTAPNDGTVRRALSRQNVTPAPTHANCLSAYMKRHAVWCAVYARHLNIFSPAASAKKSRCCSPTSSPTTACCTANATRSRTCSTSSRTGGASTPVTTAAPTPFSQPFASSRPSYSGSINES
jgi:hypothetical protein